MTTKKLTDKEKADLIIDVNSLILSDDEICKKHGIEQKQLNLYITRYRKPKLELEAQKKDPKHIEKVVNHMKKTAEPQKEAQDEDFSVEDLIGTKKKKDEPMEEEDPDLCANCHRQGLRTVLRKNQEKCVVCNSRLEWG